MKFMWHAQGGFLKIDRVWMLGQQSTKISCEIDVACSKWFSQNLLGL